jgi:hypothetical protein
MLLSKLSSSDKKLLETGLVSNDPYVRNVAESIKRTDTMSDKQRRVLLNDGRPPVTWYESRSSKRRPTQYDYGVEDTEKVMDDNDWGDAIGANPWGFDRD